MNLILTQCTVCYIGVITAYMYLLLNGLGYVCRGYTNFKIALETINIKQKNIKDTKIYTSQIRRNRSYTCV